MAAARSKIVRARGMVSCNQMRLHNKWALCVPKDNWSSVVVMRTFVVPSQASSPDSIFGRRRHDGMKPTPWKLGGPELETSPKPSVGSTTFVARASLNSIVNYKHFDDVPTASAMCSPSTTPLVWHQSCCPSWAKAIVGCAPACPVGGMVPCTCWATFSRRLQRHSHEPRGHLH